MRSAFMANIVMCLCSISSQFQTVSSTCQSLLLFLLLFYEPFWWWQIFICYFFHFGGNLKNDFGKSGFIRLIATFVKRRSLTNEPNHNFIGLSCRAWRRFPACRDLKSRSQPPYFIYWSTPSVADGPFQSSWFPTKKLKLTGSRLKDIWLIYPLKHVKYVAKTLQKKWTGDLKILIIWSYYLEFIKYSKGVFLWMHQNCSINEWLRMHQKWQESYNWNKN